MGNIAKLQQNLSIYTEQNTAKDGLIVVYQRNEQSFRAEIGTLKNKEKNQSRIIMAMIALLGLVTSIVIGRDFIGSQAIQ